MKNLIWVDSTNKNLNNIISCLVWWITFLAKDLDLYLYIDIVRRDLAVLFLFKMKYNFISNIT